MINVLFIALAVLTLGFVVVWVVEARKSSTRPTPARRTPSGSRSASSPTSSTRSASGASRPAPTYFRLRKLVRDELIPGSLNVGYCLPTITQAFIGIAVIAVEPTMLVLMIATAVAGGWVGASVVSKLPRRAIQVGMGVALLVAAAFLFAKVTRLMPADEVKVGPQAVELRSGGVGRFARRWRSSRRARRSNW